MAIGEMMADLFLDGETPSKKNSRINTKSGRSFPGKKFSGWHKRAVAELKRQWKGKPPADFPLVVSVCFFHSTRRRRDADNQLSSILDTLVDAGILLDDNSQIVRILSAENIFGCQESMAMIRVFPLEEKI